MKVREIMSTDVIAVDPHTSVPDAIRVMKEKCIRRLPVISDRGLVGIVTDRDLKEVSPSPATSLSAWELTYLLSRLPLKDVMRKHVLTLSPEDEVERAASVMYEKKIGGLPVVEDGRVVGMVTESDIFRLFVKQMAAQRVG